MITEAEERRASHPHDDNGYSNHDCRGPVCTRAHALATAETRAERRAYVRRYGLPDHVEHGASAYTNWGCRCDFCRAGHAEEVARYRTGAA